MKPTKIIYLIAEIFIINSPVDRVVMLCADPSFFSHSPLLVLFSSPALHSPNSYNLPASKKFNIVL